MAKLCEELTNFLLSKGASKVGFADLSDLDSEYSIGFNYGISIIAAMQTNIVGSLKDGPTKDYYNEYKRGNALVEELATEASDFLIKKGYQSYPQLDSNMVLDRNTWRTRLPHKTVATKAGLGWIGRNTLLVTKEYGSALWLTSVLTNAILDVSKTITETECGSCTKCEKACPASSVSGVAWEINIDRDKLLNVFECRKVAKEKAEKAGLDMVMCGICVYVCPWTQNYCKLNNF